MSYCNIDEAWGNPIKFERYNSVGNDKNDKIKDDKNDKIKDDKNDKIKDDKNDKIKDDKNDKIKDDKNDKNNNTEDKTKDKTKDIKVKNTIPKNKNKDITPGIKPISSLKNPPGFKKIIQDSSDSASNSISDSTKINNISETSELEDNIVPKKIKINKFKNLNHKINCSDLLLHINECEICKSKYLDDESAKKETNYSIIILFMILSIIIIGVVKNK